MLSMVKPTFTAYTHYCKVNKFHCTQKNRCSYDIQLYCYNRHLHHKNGCWLRTRQSLKENKVIVSALNK